MRRGTEFLLSDPAVIPILAAAYVAVGIAFVLTDYTLNDEGLLTHYLASWARRDFVPVFFCQRVRPVLSALYLPVSVVGVHATLMAHVVIASLSIPLMGAIARRLGHQLANLPALIIALSPLYLYGGPAGLSNTDGVVAMTLALYLLCVRRASLLAGLVAGMIPWIRFELAIFSTVLFLSGLVPRGDRRLLIGMLIFPSLYAMAGAVYHHDPLWLVHFPASAPPDPWNPMWEGQRVGLTYLFEALLAVTPIAALVVAVRFNGLTRIERLLLVHFVVAELLLTVLPLFQIFGASPRYSMQLLPGLALLIGRAVEPWRRGDRPTRGTVVAVGLFAVWLATRQQDAFAIGFLLVAYALLLAASSAERSIAATTVALAVVFAGPLLPLRTEVGRSLTAAYLDPMKDWLVAHPDQVHGPILTNSQLLAAFLESRMPGLQIWFIAWKDIALPLEVLTNPANGQREAIRHLSDVDFYGRTVFTPIAPEGFPVGTLLMLRADVRLQQILPPTQWESRLEILEETERYRIARLRAAAPGASGS